MRSRRRLLGALVVGAGAWSLGCVPLTFSNDAAIDFAIYRRVAVEVFPSDLALYYGRQAATSYLADALRDGSGFEQVTTDTSEEVDLFLTVRVRAVEVITYEDDLPQVEYHGHASFTAVDAAGGRVDSGSVSDASQFLSEVVEDVLDEVALHYLKPYRL